MSTDRGMDRGIKKMWYIYIMEYYLVINKNEMPFIATWMDLELILLSKTEKDKYDISLICGM